MSLNALEDDFVQQGKAVGKIFVEITGTCVEVWLENSRQLLVPVEGTHGEYALSLIHILCKKEEILDVLSKKDIEVLITLGAGDIDNYVPQICGLLNKR